MKIKCLEVSIFTANCLLHSQHNSVQHIDPKSLNHRPCSTTAPAPSAPHFSAYYTYYMYTHTHIFVVNNSMRFQGKDSKKKSSLILSRNKEYFPPSSIFCDFLFPKV